MLMCTSSTKINVYKKMFLILYSARRNINNTVHAGNMKYLCLASSLVLLIPCQLHGKTLRLGGKSGIWGGGGYRGRVRGGGGEGGGGVQRAGPGPPPAQCPM